MKQEQLSHLEDGILGLPKMGKVKVVIFNYISGFSITMFKPIAVVLMFLPSCRNTTTIAFVLVK